MCNSKISGVRVRVRFDFYMLGSICASSYALESVRRQVCNGKTLREEKTQAHFKSGAPGAFFSLTDPGVGALLRAKKKSGARHRLARHGARTREKYLQSAAQLVDSTATAAHWLHSSLHSVCGSPTAGTLASLCQDGRKNSRRTRCERRRPPLAQRRTLPF